MTPVSDDRSYVRVEIPAGHQPSWEQRYRGRLRYELDALQSAGITPVVDADALAAGFLALSFDWPLDAETTLRLSAVYPDTFPHMRPHVFLIGGLEPPPMRHRSPIEGNLCLLGRDTRHWVPSWTLHRLLSEQLEDAILGTGEEDPQGEPAEYWWNALGIPGSFCLVDSDWDLGDETRGSLLVRYIAAGTTTGASKSITRKAPVIRAYVDEVRLQDGAVKYRWKGPLPPEVAQSKQTMVVPWVRPEKTLFPKPPLHQQLSELLIAHDTQTSRPIRHSSGLLMKLIAFAYASELGFQETGLGWTFFVLSGERQAFDRKRNRNKTPVLSFLRVYRAGLADIGCRVPAITLLRQKKILVVGLGAVGAPVAIELARNACGTLHLVEHDFVEPGNTVRWPLGASVWGTQKLDALSEFLDLQYPETSVHLHSLQIGQIGGNNAPREDEILTDLIRQVDLVVDGSASHGVTTLLADRCYEAGVPFISLFATPSVQGGAVVRHAGEGGCPVCLEHAWFNDEITPPPGLDLEGNMAQPPGCAERTFVGAGYDLQELSLQAVRLVVETLSMARAETSVVYTLSFVDCERHRCPPRWAVNVLPKHPNCRCRQ